jgi:RNA polymerase sigma factor (sigma-70 family)
LKGIVGQLKEDHRLLIDLAYFEGYTQEEIAKELDIPLGTVKTRVRAALMTLRKLVK